MNASRPFLLQYCGRALTKSVQCMKMRGMSRGECSGPAEIAKRFPVFHKRFPVFFVKICYGRFRSAEGGEKMALYTAKALGNALGLSVKEINSLLKAGVISYDKGMLFQPEKAAKDIIQHYRSGEAREEIVDYSTERAKLMRAKRLGEEYELRLREGSLHEAGDVEQIVTNMLLNFRARIMAIPAKLAPSLAGESDKTSVFNILKAATDDALNELADYERLFGEGHAAEND